MKWWKALLLACFAIGAVVAQYGQFSASGAGSLISGTVSAQTSLVHITSPVANQKLGTNYVDVTYELVNPGVDGGSPNFQVQLDGRDPVSTEDTTYTFTGLTPGQHTVIVQLVDANGTPIPFGRSVVVFYVLPSASRRQDPRAPGLTANDSDLPGVAPASSALPLLSIIGFGVLLGGVASAMRTRG